MSRACRPERFLIDAHGISGEAKALRVAAGAGRCSEELMMHTGQRALRMGRTFGSRRRLLLARALCPLALAGGFATAARGQLDPELIWIRSGHSDRVNAVAFGPDGAELVSASSEGSVKQWDAESRAYRGVIWPCCGPVVDVAVSPDGQFVGLAQDRDIELWRGSDRGFVRALAHPEQVTAVAFAPNGLTVASACEDGIVRIWRVTTGQVLRELTGHTGPVTSVAYSADSMRLVSGGADGDASVWGVTSGVREIAIPTGADVLAVDFAPDGLTVASGGTDDLAKIWNVADGMLSRQLVFHFDDVTAVEYSPDGTRLLTASLDAIAAVHDIASGGLVSFGDEATDALEDATFAPDGATFVTASADHGIRRHDTANGALLTDYSVLRDRPGRFAISPDGTLIAAAGNGPGEQNQVKLFAMSDGAIVRSLESINGPGPSAFSPDGTKLAVVFCSGGIDLFDVATGALIRRTHIGHGCTFGLAWSPDGTVVATAHIDGHVLVTDPFTGSTVHDIPAHSDSSAGGVAYSPDGSILASVGGDGHVRIWDAATGGAHGNVPLVDPVSVAFSADGALIASGGIQRVGLWRTSDLAPVHEFTNLAWFVERVQFASDDGVLLASTGCLGGDTAYFWDLSDFSEIVVYNGEETNRISSIALAPDERTFAYSRCDATVALAVSPLDVLCPADLDRSGAVDFGDILAILTAWGNAGGPEDLDSSGLVDFGDILVVLSSWGECG